jgi:hypothetical protein
MKSSSEELVELMDDNYEEAIRMLLIELEKGESSAIELGWVSIEEVEKEVFRR